MESKMKYKLGILTHMGGNVQCMARKQGCAIEPVPRSEKVRHRRPTAHARARYRCFLPDLAGLAGVRRAGPMPDLFDSNIPFVLFPSPMESPTMGEYP